MNLLHFFVCLFVSYLIEKIIIDALHISMSLWDRSVKLCLLVAMKDSVFSFFLLELIITFPDLLGFDVDMPNTVFRSLNAKTSATSSSQSDG